MPACARQEIVLAEEVGVYHVWTRCVRRSFLCGMDLLTGRDFRHRRGWIRDYLPRLCQLFAVEAGTANGVGSPFREPTVTWTRSPSP